MSHGLCFVALPAYHTGSVEEAVAQQMEPFHENDHYFSAGSRWDWWSIGGRYTGVFDGYIPQADPKNWELCDLCGGTDTRVLPFRGNADWRPTPGWCNGCGGSEESPYGLPVGQRVKLSTPR